jgi:osmotically-inducible protein OsmY
MKIFKQGIALGSVLLVLCASASASDQPIDRRVATALQAAPYLYAEHITVTSKDGVVTLHGTVGSPWDLREAIKISSRVPGVHAVVDDLEIWDFTARGR